MARERDEGKRDAILAAAKRLFAEKGFHAASVSGVAREAELPVGTVYTYFRDKKDLITCIIEEGWSGFFAEVEAAIGRESSPSRSLSLILGNFLPELFSDTELVSILLADGFRYTDFGGKLDRLAHLVADVVDAAAKEAGMASPLSPRDARTALCVFLLGGLDTIRLAGRAGLSIDKDDVIAFIRNAAVNALSSMNRAAATGAADRGPVQVAIAGTGTPGADGA